MYKVIPFFGKTASGVFCQPLFGSAGVFEKTAGAPAFANWDNGDQIRRFISGISKEDRKKHAYVLVNALGGGEYFGSNINADYFPWNALAHQGDDYGYLTFLKANAFQHHVNKDPTKAFGKPVLSLLNTRMKRVELIVQLDREKAKIEGADGIIARIDNGEFPDVSMGCKVPYDVCYVCEHRSKTKDDYCVHMKPPEELRHLYGPNRILANGMKCCVKNPHPRFFDISFVFIGADKTAKVMAKLASKGRQVCLGEVCAVPQPSSEMAERLVKIPGEEPQTIQEVAKGFADRIRVVASEKTAFKNDDIISGGKADKKPLSKFQPKSLKAGVKVELEHSNSKALAKEIASDHLEEDPKYYEKLKTIHKEASAPCECGCPGGCSDLDKLGFAMTGKKPKMASQSKVGEIIKTVPAGTFALKSLPSLEKDEITISRSALDEMAEHDLGSCCSTTGMMGIVLKPGEFQRIVLVRMGEKDLANELDDSGKVFKQTHEVDESVPMDKELFNPVLMRLLSGLIGSRSGFGGPLQGRVLKLATVSKKTLPTETSIDHPMLHKIGAAYNGYRRSLLKKMSQAEEVVQNDPKLRDAVFGNSLVNMFTKTASAPVLSRDSISYFAGVHLQNRNLLLDTTVDTEVFSQFSNQA